MPRQPSTPDFGEADLSNCEREQIHLAGSIQPHGALLVVREPDLTIIQASANAASFLGHHGSLLGLALDRLGGNLLAVIDPHLTAPLDTTPVALHCRIGLPAHDYDALIHRPPAGGLVIEIERSQKRIDLSDKIAGSLRRIVGCLSIRALSDEAARIFKDIAGYDRVMTYRFDDDGHGEVLSEQREAALEAFLGNRYPASDIPQIARRLYERYRVRMLGDVFYEPVPLEPRLSPVTGQQLDMSLCFLRSMSPIHIQYLKNMGVGATLVISLVVGGRLWGLVACHHYQPRLVPFAVRAACELLAEAVATRVAALESFTQSQAERAVQRLEQRMIEAIATEGDWRGALFDQSHALLQPLGASGAALLCDGQILTTGTVPGTRELREIGQWLERLPPQPITATVSLGRDNPDFAGLKAVASGLVATPVSRSPGEYLLWFRPERIHTVTWGGNPFKPVTIGDDPRDLSPRRSFSQWHQLMEGSAEPWTAADLTAARLVGGTVADVVLQFRAVQMLIAQEQLDQVRQQVHVSDQPVVIADADGKILLTNSAFADLIPTAISTVRHIRDLARFLEDEVEANRRLGDLVRHGYTWRGEIDLKRDGTSPRPLLIRADPVYASLERIRGFVLLLTDNTEQKLATIARRRFQEGLIATHRPEPRQFGAKLDVIYSALMSTIIENAQLAALEITDRTDVERMPEMLESVRDSVARITEMLDLLIHQSRAEER